MTKRWAAAMTAMRWEGNGHRSILDAAIVLGDGPGAARFMALDKAIARWPKPQWFGHRVDVVEIPED